jgi:hypothetical protein
MKLLNLREMPGAAVVWCPECDGAVSKSASEFIDLVLVPDFMVGDYQNIENSDGAGPFQCDCPVCSGEVDYGDFENNFEMGMPIGMAPELPRMFERLDDRRPSKRRDIHRRSLRRIKRLRRTD